MTTLAFLKQRVHHGSGSQEPTDFNAEHVRSEVARSEDIKLVSCQNLLQSSARMELASADDVDEKPLPPSEALCWPCEDEGSRLA